MAGNRMTEFNYRGVMICVGTALILIALLAFVLSSGCVTAGKNLYRDTFPTPTPTPTPTPPPTPEPTPTPTPEPTLSPAQYMAAAGGLPMGEWVSWRKENVSGLKDMSTHVTVYGYRMFGTVEWRSVSWGQYFRIGAGDGMKWLFVFVNTYSDQDMARMWGIQPYQFRLQIDNETFEPSEALRPEIRIKQLDDVWNLDHVENVKPYGYLRTIDKTGEHVEALGFIKAGCSNAWDGYLVFAIPKDTKPEDIKVLAQFGSLSDPRWWQLE